MNPSSLNDGSAQTPGTNPVSGNERYLHSVSYLSDRSLDYVVIRDLDRRLERSGWSFIPLYFWSSREGRSSLARNAAHRPVRLVTVFSRCLEWVRRSEHGIEAQIDSRIAAYVTETAADGVPTIFGAPHIDDIFAATAEAECSWWVVFGLHQPASNYPHFSLTGVNVQELTEAQLLDLFAAVPPRPWEQAVAHLRRYRPLLSGGETSFFVHGRRPFYLLLISTPQGSQQSETRVGRRGYATGRSK